MRAKKHRHIQFKPKIRLFKPQGDGTQEAAVILLDEELEALRLKNIENLDQEDAAEKMGISQSTFQRIIQELYKKIAVALIEGRAISIIGEKKKIECWECTGVTDEAKRSSDKRLICQPCQNPGFKKPEKN